MAGTTRPPTNKGKRRKPRGYKPPNPDALKGNDERLVAAAKQSAASPVRRRNSNGTFARVRPVEQPEPPRDNRHLDWSFDGTEAETAPITLMQPFEHSLDHGQELDIKLAVVPFAERVTPEVERPVSFIDQIEAQVRAEKRAKSNKVARTAGLMFFTLVIIVYLGLGIYIWFRGVV